MDLTQKKEHQIIIQEKIDDLMRVTLNLPQADCPVAHYFGPGIYIRQVTFPAGVFAIGHKQRFEQMNIFLQGRLAMIQPDGSTKEIKAPMIFMGPPGQKMGMVLETTTWLNVYPNPDNERDIDILEDRFLDKEGPWSEKEFHEKQRRIDARNEDREDFDAFVNEYGLDKSIIRCESENESDLIPMPVGFETVLSVRISNIDGVGIFTSWPIQCGDLIAPALINGFRTPIGRYTNHAKDPNAIFKKLQNGDIVAIAKRDINGCRGGDQGEEITVDYRQVMQMKMEEICRELPQP